jgi:hypothetical protein
MAILKSNDANGQELKEGDICEVTVKYKVLKVYDDGNVLAQKVYDIPSNALRKTGESIQ